MNRYIRLTYIFLAGILGIVMPGCADDFPGFGNGDYLEGETTVTLEASFSPFAEGDLTRATVVKEGNGKRLDMLNDLCILIYDTDGNIIDADEYPKQIEFKESDLTDDDRNDEDASNYDSDKGSGGTAESKTKSLKNIRLKVPFGTYYIIGVSNLEGGTIETLKTTSDANGQPAYTTLEGLRRMKVNWNSDISKNGEMMGYFTDSELSKGVPAGDRPFSTVSVNRPGMKLHSWLRRAASKITIDFDGSNLRENINIYIKEARIYDIAYDCTLGFGSVMTNKEDERSYNHRVSVDSEKADGFIHEGGQVISYAIDKNNTSSSDLSNFPLISKGTPLIKDNKTVAEYPTANVIDFHNEKGEALYFYENMQDNPDGKTKVPVTDLNNGTVVKGEDKDGIDHGTYIEVVGYYDSNADGNSSKGEIRYRFMIGKNVTDNFEAERNYHYKLTLKPRGNGNEADWHISYNEPKGFHVPNPWYVSYLYNHEAQMPFKYTPEDGWELIGMKAEILTNPWYPSKWEEEELVKCKYPETGPDGNPFKLPVGATKEEQKDILPTTPKNEDDEGDDEGGYTEGVGFNRNNCNGFLSLRVTNKRIITPADAKKGFSWQYGPSGSYAQHATDTLNADYYNGRSGANESTSSIDRARRVYIEDGKPKTYEDYPAGTSELDKKRDEFTYSKQGESWSFSIPMFTRAKAMVKATGYSGNNPFVGYQRIARVKMIATLKHKTTGDTKTDEDYVNVVQVRRVVNPKGVYRKGGNNEPFHVRMMWLDGDYANNFSSVISHGPWKAEIIGDENFITLDGRQTVSGHSNEPIDFTIRFNKMNNKDDGKVRNAVVRIKYHNYTCTHLIFVRQGYAAQALSPGGPEWETCNMIAASVPATDPRDEGSLFKHGNGAEPIDAVNNSYGEDYHIPSEFTQPGELVITDPDGTTTKNITKKWSEIGSGPEFKGIIDNVATMKELESLYWAENMQFGYGVLYADGATETAVDFNKAYGYRRNGDQSCGMRGLFAYFWNQQEPNNTYTAKNVFFPIGRSGYGHRKEWKEGADGNQAGNGILRYACTRGAANSTLFSHSAPLFVSIYRRPGAIYWADTGSGGIHDCDDERTAAPTGAGWGLDINYFSFDVNLISKSNVHHAVPDNDETGWDACFVRCVKR